MAVSANATKLVDLFDPEVIAARIEKKLTNAIKFAPLAKVEYSLEGRPGSKVLLPYYNYIGMAETVPEGNDVPVKKLSEQTTEVSIAKVGIGVEITDEAVLSGYGNPIDESVAQIITAISDKVDAMLVTNLAGNEVNHKELAKAFTADDVADALILFGEDIESNGQVLIVDADGYAELRKSKNWIPNTEVGANIIMTGVVGSIYGCQVIVSNRITTDYYIVKPGALAIYLKRDVMVETDRDVVAKTTVVTADKHFATYLLDPSKAIKITKFVG